MPDFILLCQDPNRQETARQLAEKYGFVYGQQAQHGLVLSLETDGLQLKNLDEPKTGGVMVDFISAAMSWRREHGGGLKEAVAKAVGVKGNYHPTVFDATAGLGRDAFILANLGCTVTMTERSPIVAALLEDGLQRGIADPAVQRMRLLNVPALQAMQNWQDEQPDVVYLDPMFPHRKKSAAVKKDMRLFQLLLGPDLDADGLLAPARQLAKKRVVVKRPANAPYLAECKPSIEMKGKANRFDIYLNP